MRKILMSIKPQYADKILRKDKCFEYRKILCAQPINSIVIYETAPKKKVVAEVKVLDVLVASPEIIWEKTKYAAGMEKSEFDNYFKGTLEAVAYVLGDVIDFAEPRDLSFYGVSRAPQSFQYIDD